MASIGIEIRDLSVSYAGKPALRSVSLEIPPNQIFGIIGPANSGKTTLLKCINRTIDFVNSAHVEGHVSVGGQDVRKVNNVYELRRRIGMVFPLPVGLPMSIYDNVAYGMKIHGMGKNGHVSESVENALRAVGLWNEVSGRLKAPATGLSGGQQQRLCLARALAVQPEILLCDESTASLDPIAAQGIESLLLELRGQYTLVIVTHNIAQARRLADYVMFMWLGELVEHGPAPQFFNEPQEKLTQEYLARRIG